jgi:hypothetical protein
VANLIYHAVDDDGIAISLYVPSRVRLDIQGQVLVIEQQTRLPDENQSVIRVIESPREEVTLWLRLPSWSEQVVVRLNQSALSDPLEGGRWLAVRRVWSPGDVLTIIFETRLVASPVDHLHLNRAALRFGPVVLAQDGVSTTPLSAPVPWQMVDWDSLLVRDGQRLAFRPVAPGAAPLPAGDLRPLYDFPERHPYRVYFDLDAPRFL